MRKRKTTKTDRDLRRRWVLGCSELLWATKTGHPVFILYKHGKEGSWAGFRAPADNRYFRPDWKREALGTLLKRTVRNSEGKNLIGVDLGWK